MGRARKNLTLEARIEVARRFAAGESAKDLAAAFGISRRHVNRIAKEEAGEGITVRDPSETVAFRANGAMPTGRRRSMRYCAGGAVSLMYPATWSRNSSPHGVRRRM